MAKLILSVDGQVLKEHTLSKERTLIGRKPHNDIQIDNLAVSGEHAAIITILNDSFIEDLGSTNGTMVNGKPIKKHFLQNNDVIEIGKHKLKYFNDAPTAATAADFEKTMIIRSPAKARRRPPAAGPKALSDTATGMKAFNVEAPTPAQPRRRRRLRRLRRHRPRPRPPRPPAPRRRGSRRCPRRRRAAGPAARRRHPGALRRCRRAHAGPHQEPHHHRQAGLAGGGDHQAAQRLLHHPRRGGHLSHPQRGVAGRRRRTC